ncbi:MAG TPA: hypothetical protein VIC62_01380, partial [Nakamurella sp.]
MTRRWDTGGLARPPKGGSGGRGTRDLASVGVADPIRPDAVLATLGLKDEAIATSSVGKRRW